MLIPLNENGEPMMVKPAIKTGIGFRQHKPILIQNVDENGEVMVKPMPVLMSKGPLVNQSIQDSEIIRITQPLQIVNDKNQIMIVKDVAQKQQEILEKSESSSMVYYIIYFILFVLLIISLFFALRR